MKVKEKSTAKALAVAILSTFLCVAMLFGTTYAWFTSNVTTGTNTISTAAFNVSLQYCDTYNGTYSDLTDSSVLFNSVTLKPGESTGVMYIKITNNNDYAVNASVSVGTVTTTGGTNEMELYAATGVTESKTISQLTKQGDTLAAATILNNVAIAANGSTVVAIAVSLPTTATAASVTNSFAITVGATQQSAS